MANTFLLPQQIIAQALGLLFRELVLPAIVWRDSRIETAMVGAKDSTVTLKLPARLTAREYAMNNNRSAPLVADDIEEIGVDVRLDKHPYHLGNITDEQLTLSITDFGRQVQAPQIRAVAEKLESYIAEALLTATYGEATIPFDDPYNTAVDARQALNDNHVPFGDRFLVMGSGIEAAYLKSDLFKRADQSGTDSALREATLGRVAGFTGVTSTLIPPGIGIGMHRTAVAMANIAPQVPAGAAAGARAMFEGLALAWIRDYDAQYSRDRSLVHAFAGATAVADGGTEGARTVVRAVVMSMVSTLSVTPATATLTSGSPTQQLSATVDLADGTTAHAVPASMIRWTSSDATKATVSASGLVTRVAVGSATITGSYGGKTDTSVITLS